MRIRNIFTRIFCLFAGLLFSEVSYSQVSVTPKWVSIATNSTGIGMGNQRMVISQGHLYSIATFRGRANFGPGPGSVELVTQTMNQVDADIAIAKYDLDGNVLWVKQVGGTDEDQAYGITADDAGNVYVTGAFRKTVDFNPGTGLHELTATGADPAKGGNPESTDDDIFILKLNANGDFVWAHAFGAITADIGYGIKAHGSHIYVTGAFRRTIDFDPGPEEHTLSAPRSNPADPNTSAQIFVAKYGLDGSYVWAKAMGGLGNERPYALDVDASGNVYTIGAFAGTANFNPDGESNISSLGSNDAFISKLNAQGGFEWVKAIRGSSFHDMGTSIAIDNGGNVVAGGFFEGSVEFFPDDEGGELLNGGGYYDAFVVKLEPDGSLIWARSMGGTGNFDEEIFGVATDPSNNVYVGGRFQNTIDLDPGPATDVYSVKGGRDMFFAKLSASGNYEWGKVIGGNGSDILESVTIHEGDVYIGGLFAATVDFDPEDGVMERSGTGNTIFIGRYSQSAVQPPAPCPADVTFTSQADVTAFVNTYSHCTSITGNVTVQGTVANLNGLTNLKSIGGDLKFDNVAALQDITGLSGLQTVGGNVVIFGSFPLQNLTGLGALQSIGRDLQIGEATVSSRPSLKNLSGLGALQSIGGWLTLTWLPELQSLDGLSALQTLGGPLFITNNPKLENLDELSDFHGLQDEVFIGYNEILTQVNGLSGLVNIPGRLVFSNNAKLSDISGVSGVKSIGKGLYIGYNPLLQNLNALSGVTSIGDEINITNNTGLSSVEGLKNADIGGVNYLYITNNGALSICNLPNICTYLNTAKSRTISGNLGNCATEAAVQAACSASPFTLTLAEAVNPQTCGGTDGAIVLMTTLPDGDYQLDFKKSSKDSSAAVEVINGTFVLEGLRAGSYTNFSITYQSEVITAPGQRTLQGPITAGGSILADGSLEFCAGSSVKLTAPEGASYEWSTGATTRSIQVTESGVYEVKVTSQQGCVSQSQIQATKKECNVPPMAVCKPVVVLVAGDDCYAMLRAEDLDAGSYDSNNDWFIRNIDINPLLRVGSHTATMTVIDIHGTSTSCVSQVHVVDHSAPVVWARDVTLELNEQGRASLTIGDVDAGSHDNCGPVQLSLSRTEFDCRDLGTRQVILTGTDGSGNVSTAVAHIRVVDNRAPVVTTQALEIYLDEKGQATLEAASLAQTIMDNCGIWSIQASKTTFSCDDLGEQKVTLRVEDVQGTVTEAEVTVMVKDTMAPVLQAGPVTLYLDESGKAILKAEELTGGSTDNCGIESLELSRSEFGCDDTGEHEVTLKGTDKSGNTAEMTIIVTVADTTAPVIMAKDVTLELDGSGRAKLSTAMVEGGSTDNCGIESRELQYTDFDCSDLGEHSVQYKISDKAGNESIKTIRVTIKDVTAPIAQAQDLIVELDGAGQATLEAAQLDDGSTDNCGIVTMTLSQTTFSCADLGKRLITLTVRDGSGNESTARAEVLIRDAGGICPCSYGVLAEEKITLKNNEIHAGGIGTSGSKGLVRLRNTLVNEEGTFVKSERTRFDNESESSVYMRGRAPQAEGFRKNGQKEKKKEKIKKGETRTFSQGSYGKIRGKKESKLIFSGGDVQIRSLKLGRGAEVSFSGATELLVRDGVKVGREVEYNRAGELAKLYAGGDVKIGGGSDVKGYIHSQGRLKTVGGKEKYLEGFFAAERIKGGRNTYWSGGGVLCRENETQALLAQEKRERRKAEGTQEEIVADSVAGGETLRVRIWPNPVRDRAQVEIVSESAGGEVTLVDLMGNVLRRASFHTREETVNLQVQTLSPGLYILRVQSGSEVVTLRVIKEKL